MDELLDDHDCLYDSLPEMCDTSSSLCNENLATSSLKAENTACLTSENPSNSDGTEQDHQETCKKCSCRDNVQWIWDSDSKSRYVDIVNDNMDVRFHRAYSNGTAVVRCTEPMSENQYYWEMKMTCPVYGTDIMVGVGTSDAKIRHMDRRFVSLLGMDDKTWGFSYTGLFHHNGQRRCYAQSFGQGSIIGVHLDLWKGTLSFYKDRKNLGVASSGLKGKTLYAMASSTAARSGMRIVYSRSFPSSLQFLCCAKLRDLVPDDQNVLDVINIPPGLKQFLHSKLNWLLDKRSIEKNFSPCCRVIDFSSEEEGRSEGSTANNTGHDITPLENPFEGIGSNIGGQFILLGSVLFSNHNRFQRAIRNQISEEREDLSEADAKRRRFSYTMGFSDHDSD